MEELEAERGAVVAAFAPPAGGQLALETEDGLDSVSPDRPTFLRFLAHVAEFC